MKLKNRNDILLLSFVLFIIVIVIALIITIIKIWTPTNKNTEITSYTYNGFENEIIMYYTKQLEKILKKDNSKILISKLDNEYLNSINLKNNDNNEIIKYLEKEQLLSDYPKIINYTVSSNTTTGVYVYNFTYNTNGLNKKVYLIETKPYVYTISFNQEYSPTTALKDIVETKNNIKFEISVKETTNESIKYNAKITNNNSNNIKFDFNNVASVELTVDDGSKIKVAGVIATNEND